VPRRRAREPAARARRLTYVVLAGVMVWGHLDATALGTFNSAPSPPSMTVASATLESASSLSAANQNCVVATSTEVRLTWTATSSTWADGYEIFRSLISGGPYTSKGTVSGQSTVTWTDTTPLFSTTYYYVVKATKNNWRSANSNQASITTPTLLCA